MSFQRSGISTKCPSLLIFPVNGYTAGQRRYRRQTGGWVRVYKWLLHDANAAIELALRVVIVDVRVAAAHVGGGHRGQGAVVVGAAVLK